jgi:hypothetical protein
MASTRYQPISSGREATPVSGRVEVCLREMLFLRY